MKKRIEVAYYIIVIHISQQLYLESVCRTEVGN